MDDKLAAKVCPFCHDTGYYIPLLAKGGNFPAVRCPNGCPIAPTPARHMS
jgi:hypothetical protein